MSNETPTSSGGGQTGPPLLSDYANDPDMLELVEHVRIKQGYGTTLTSGL